MDLNEIKNIIEEEKGKFIVVENGKPILVITSFEEYKNQKGGFKDQRLPLQETPASIDFSEDEKQLPKELAEDPLKIEDLPF